MDNYVLDDEDDIIYFDTDIYINDILSSYNYDENNIRDQIRQDLPRADVYWNNKKIDNFDIFLKLSERYKDIGLVYNNVVFHLQLLLGMLINQSSYYFPYKTLYNTFDNMGESNLIRCLSKNRYIKFHNEDDELIVDIAADFALTDIYTSSVSKYITTSVVLHLDDNGFRRCGMFLY